MLSSKRRFWVLDLLSRDLLLTMSFLPSFFLLCKSPSLPFSSFRLVLLLFFFFFFPFLRHSFRLSTSFLIRFSFSSPLAYPQDSSGGKALWFFGVGTKGTPQPCQHHLPKELNLKREFPPATTSPSYCQLIIASHLMVKNWPETKEIQFQAGLRESLGVSLRPAWNWISLPPGMAAAKPTEGCWRWTRWSIGFGFRYVSENLGEHEFLLPMGSESF